MLTTFFSFLKRVLLGLVRFPGKALRFIFTIPLALLFSVFFRLFRLAGGDPLALLESFGDLLAEGFPSLALGLSEETPSSKAADEINPAQRDPWAIYFNNLGNGSLALMGSAIVLEAAITGTVAPSVTLLLFGFGYACKGLAWAIDAKIIVCH